MAFCPAAQVPPMIRHGPRSARKAPPGGDRGAQRFWSKVNVGKPNDCWTWKASTTTGGYGQFLVEGRLVHAHRVAYTLTVGPIPEGLELDHLCRNRRCVNPTHLEPVTRQENIRRGEGLAGINARKTHCPRGHALSGDNLYKYQPKDRPGPRRRCKVCHRAQRLGQL